jgi:hypothetical protein
MRLRAEQGQFNFIESRYQSHRGAIVCKNRNSNYTLADRNAETQRIKGPKCARKVFEQKII